MIVMNYLLFYSPLMILFFVLLLLFLEGGGGGCWGGQGLQIIFSIKPLH